MIGAEMLQGIQKQHKKEFRPPYLFCLVDKSFTADHSHPTFIGIVHIMSVVIEFFTESLELLLGGRRRRNQSSTARNADVALRIFLAAILIAIGVAIFVFWATIVTVAITVFWIAVLIGLGIGIFKFFAD
jgi:heme A synthase